MSYSVFPEVYVISLFAFIYFLIASGSGKGKSKNGFRVFCTVLLVLYCAALIWLALIARIGNDQRELLLTPFRSVKTVLNVYNSFDVFKLIVDNVLIFIPLGMLLPVAAGKYPSGKSFALTVFSGAVVSLLIEALQYAFSLGYSEVDDLIYNTIGCMIGAGIFTLSGYADNKSGTLHLKKGWFVYLSPAFLFAAVMFVMWIYREYILFKK